MELARSFALRAITIGLFLQECIPASAEAAKPRLPDQVVVIRTSRATQIRLAHTPGDSVAVLRILNPPKDVSASLREQKGPFVRAFEHQHFEDNTLTLLIRLSTDAVNISKRRLRNPSGWAISFAPRELPPFPSPEKLIGHLPGLKAPPRAPVLMPAEPNDTPCTGNPDAKMLLMDDGYAYASEVRASEAISVVAEPICRSWIWSRLALRALEEDGGLQRFEQWAFLFPQRWKTWKHHPQAFAQASLVASEILSRLDYIPEAERLLADSQRYSRSEGPFRAMALANHLSHLDKRNEAETLYAQLVAEGFQPLLIHRATLGRALNSFHGRDVRGALAHIERARGLISRTEDLPGDLWFFGGEAALALGEIELARKNYKRAAKASDAIYRALGLLRLGDLELRAGRRQSALRGWAMSLAAGGEDCISDHVHLRRVLVLEPSRVEAIRFLNSAAKYSRCPAVQTESYSAIATIHQVRGEEALGLSPALLAREIGLANWSPAGPHEALITRLIRSLVERFWRHDDAPGLVAFFESRLESLRVLLDDRSRLLVGRAYKSIGAPLRGSDELLELAGDPELPFREQLLLTLGETFLDSGDVFRADLVLRHLRAKHTPGKYGWQRERLAARLAIARRKPDQGLRYFNLSRAQLPRGDRRAEIELERAQALISLGRVETAARSMSAAVEARSLEDSELLPTAISVLSECARRCSRTVLLETTRIVLDRLGKDQLSPRLMTMLSHRGALEIGERPKMKTKQRNSELWSRLDALGIDTRPRLTTSEGR